MFITPPIINIQEFFFNTKTTATPVNKDSDVKKDSE